jgi:hypothetical protein
MDSQCLGFSVSRVAGGGFEPPGEILAELRAAGSGSKMSLCLPRNVIVANGERPPSGDPESLPLRHEYPSVDTLRVRSGVTLRDLIEMEGEGF